MRISTKTQRSGKLRASLLPILQDGRSAGIVLIVLTVTSVLSAHYLPSYRNFWGQELFSSAGTHLPHYLRDWINDGVMTIFFFTVALEIKSEMAGGQLSSFSKALFPVGAALGGMIVPALIFTLFNWNTEFQHGWGIPTATDIAFPMGVLYILGKRIPPALTLFLLALAVMDDLGAILLIAFFYGARFDVRYLVAAVLLTAILGRLSMRTGKVNAFFILAGATLWYLVYNSGVHGTVAGVILAFCVPSWSVPHLQLRLHTLVNFVILPVFVMANTSFEIHAGYFRLLSHPLSLGIICGLFFGKPLGIVLSAYLLIRSGLCRIPEKCNFNQLFGAAILAGAGFTMSILSAVSPSRAQPCTNPNFQSFWLLFLR